MSPRSGAENVRDTINDAEEPTFEPPLPLMRELPPADPFPVDALGDMLAPAARAINDRVQAPLAICGQSVLATATLALQPHANITLPTDHPKPLSSNYMSVALTGERKSAVDHEALLPVRQREAALRVAYANDRLNWQNKQEAWDEARKLSVKGVKGDRGRIEEILDQLGPAPLAPLEPLLTCPEPTYEGLCKLLAVGQPSLGIFSAEGGQFIGGHGMADDAKLRTAAGLSSLWDGEPIKRARAIDGVTVLPGRRVAMHLMAQPDVAALWFRDRLLADQGLMSRVLVTAPDPASGTRIWKEPSPDSHASLQRYGARLLAILEMPLPLAPGTRNELAPRMIPMSAEARRLWTAFHDHVEVRPRVGGELEPVRGLANKLPEHSARIAAVLALAGDIEASAVAAGEMEAGIRLAEHYAMEALRLFGAGRISAELREAQQLLAWLQSWPEPIISLADIYQFGPNSIRDAARARRATAILVDHRWLVVLPPGKVAGKYRREIWKIVRG